MSIIYRYLTREFVKFFGVVLLLLVTINGLFDFLATMNRFMKAGVSFTGVATYVLLKSPYMMTLFIPVCTVLSAVILVGLMNKNNELTALRGGGVSTASILKPLLVIGFVLAAVLFLFSETIVPYCQTKANEFKKSQVKKQSLATSSGKNIWIKGNRSIVHIKYYNPTKKSIYGVSVYNFDEKFRLSNRVDAKNGSYIKGEWILEDVLEQVIDDSEEYQVNIHNKLGAVIELKPDDLNVVAKKSVEMSFPELWKYIEKVEAEGYDATMYKVDLQGKAAFPFVCVIMCFIGAGIAVRSDLKGKLALSVSFGIGGSLLYWFLHSFCISLGYGEVLPPIVAAWVANVLFICVGSIIYFNAE